MKQKPKRRKPKHTTATKPARHKNYDIKCQQHVRYRTGKRLVKTNELAHTQTYKMMARPSE